MKVLFLDFDGVLNSKEWFITNKKKIQESSGLTWRSAHELNPDQIRKVLAIVDATNAAIVVSSSWRICHDLDEIREIFKMAGFPEMGTHIIDATPFHRLEHSPRGDEIQEWIETFESKNGKLTSFCIVDDDSDMLPRQMSHFVQTSWDDGINDEHVEKIIKILGATRVPV